MGNLKRKEYEAALEPLQVELNAMARWLSHTGTRLVVILEGRAESAPVPPDRAFATQLAGLYKAKYAAHEYAPEPSQWDEGGLYVIRPRRALGWMLKPGMEFGRTYTRWRWG